MWGNLLGWCISAAMVALTLGGIVTLNHSLNSISAPTAFSTTSGVGNALELPAGIDDLLTKEAGPADPASIYRQAIAHYNSDRTTFDHFTQSRRRDELVLIQPTLDLLVQASGNLPAAIFADTPQDVVNYQSDTPLAALRTLGDCLSTGALLTRLTDKKRGHAEFDAAFALGARLARERLTYAELSDGLGLMGGAAIELGSMEADVNNADQAAAYRKFAAALTDYSNQKLTPIESVLSSIDPGIIERNAGDVFWTAINSKSKTWRVEAMLALGRYKFNAPTLGDNRGALRVVTQFAQSEPDPAVKVAATAARDLTSEQAQLLH